MGSTKVIKADVRFVAASNKNLSDLISRQEFREDLYYRLNVFPIHIPPLRDRKSDIPLLLNHFPELQARSTGKSPKTFSNKAVSDLMAYDWPGYVRELQNLVERLVTITRGPVIHLADIPPFSLGRRKIEDLTLKKAVQLFERQYISDMLEVVDGNKKEAARRLGVHRNTLMAKLNNKS